MTAENGDEAMAYYGARGSYSPKAGRYDRYRNEIRAQTIEVPYSVEEAQNRYGLKTERGYRNRVQKEYNDRMADLKTVEDAPVVDGADIRIRWTRGGISGRQAHATVDYRYTDSDGYTHRGTVEGRGTQGGGYDKESTAIANAFNADPALRRIAYDIVDSGQDKPYAINDGYGSARWQGGVGVGSYRAALKQGGYDMEDVYSDDKATVYRIRREKFRSAARRAVLPEGSKKRRCRCSSTALTPRSSAPTGTIGRTCSATSGSTGSSRTTAPLVRTSPTRCTSTGTMWIAAPLSSWATSPNPATTTRRRSTTTSAPRTSTTR